MYESGEKFLCQLSYEHTCNYCYICLLSNWPILELLHVWLDTSLRQWNPCMLDFFRPDAFLLPNQ